MAMKTIPAGHGTATKVPAQSIIKIYNTSGAQVIDLWAFSTSLDSSTAIPPDYQDLSMAASHTSLMKLVPQVGDTLVTNERKGMLTVVEDTSGGQHDTLVQSCDRWRYEQLGMGSEHRNCADNLVEGMKELGIPAPPFTPAPLNLFFNVGIQSGSGAAIAFGESASTPGSYISLKAEMDLIVVMSACPMAKSPADGHYEVIASPKK